ncbi:MAG TPA: site-2 protease family protein [Gemmataceae bacterium]|nr:site-2 protease family protein [Gemmataceae bacterium]
MFGTRWRMFRLLGIPVSVDLSWLIILGLLTFTFAYGFPTFARDYFPRAAEVQLSVFTYWIMGLITAIAFFACILLHELGHAAVARSRRMPVRGITLFLFGGVAEISDEPSSASDEFFMAIAGPAVTVVLAIICGLLSWFGYTAGWAPPVYLVLGYLAFVNIMVLVFNLIPAFPLDGGRVFRSILWGASGNLVRSTHWASIVGRVFAWLLIAWGVVLLFSGNLLAGIWTGLIGMFLNSAAQSAYQQILIRKALRGEPIRKFMNPHPVVVAPSLDLRTWVDDFVYRYHRKAFPVVENGHLEGLIETKSISDTPRAEWAHHTVNEVMRRDLKKITIPPNADALQALRKMQRTGMSRLLVGEGDHLDGILSLKDLMHFLNLKLELERDDGQTPDEIPMAEPVEEEDRDTDIPIRRG